MRRQLLTVAGLLAANGVYAAVKGLGRTTSEISTVTPSPTGAPIQPCAVVSSSWSVQRAANPTATPTVSATLAHDCLNSIPLGKQEAIDLVDAIEPYLEWQSDAAYKASPPPGYYYPAYDMFDELAKIRANLVANKYKNEWEWQHDLYIKVFGPAHDGHFVFYPDALTRVFEWRRARSLISVSEDGISLPVIKVYEDYISSPSTASIVKLINGIDAATYISNIVNAAGWNQDPDAAYNSMFFSLANVLTLDSPGYFARGGRIRYIYQGPNTTFTFGNGTVVTFENTAAVKGDLSGVADGMSYYSKFCTPAAASAADVSVSRLVSATDVSIGPGYPLDPVISTGDGVVSGYYLDSPEFSDVAVLVLTAFESQSIPEFQAVLQDFLAEARDDGKTKLIIDLQGNGGGYILQGYDFFRQLFPSVIQDGFSRWKESDSFMAMSRIASDRVKGVNPYTTADQSLVAYWETWHNYRYDLDINNKHFKTFEDKFAPHVYEHTKYTDITRWDLNDNLTTTNTTWGMGIEITGYGALANESQPFRAEDIILLYDGTCASTCTLASEMLRIQAGVKSVAMGGRPKPGRIQGVGGVKGAQVLQYASIRYYAQSYLENAQSDAQRRELDRFTDLPILRSTSAAVNVRDQILRGNVRDGVPAQFVKEEADCRLYWTPAMLIDVSEIWKAVAGVAWNGAKCNAGALSGVYGKEGESAGRRTPPVTRKRERKSDSVRRLPISSKQAADKNWAATFRQRAIP
ncbi:hypothetical protein V8F20_002455 [Naviculisporaceae sp. PSN 640]